MMLSRFLRDCRMFSEDLSTFSDLEDDYAIESEDPEVIAEFEVPLEELQSLPSPAVPVASTLDLIEDLWMSKKPVLKNLKAFLGAMSKYGMKKRSNKEIMKIVKQTKDHLHSLIKAVSCSNLAGKTCSIDNFYTHLQDQKLFTTYTQDYMTEEMVNELRDACKQYSLEQFSSSANIMDTITSSMTAITNDRNVSAPEHCNLLTTSGNGGLAGLFGQTIITPDTGRISLGRIFRNRNWAEYFETGERKIIFAEIAGRNWISSDSTGRVRRQQYFGQRQTPMVETCESSHSISDFLSCGSEIDSSKTSPGPSGGRSCENSKCETRGKGYRLLEWLKKQPTAPIKHVLNTNTWYQSPYKFWSRSNMTLKTCFMLRQMELINVSTFELYSYYTNDCDSSALIFNAPDGNVAEYYYNIEESVNILQNLLTYQCDGNIDMIMEFLINLYNIIECNIPKRNAFFILSPPNAGKNYFVDCVIHYYLNFGQIGNFSKYYSFPLR